MSIQSGQLSLQFVAIFLALLWKVEVNSTKNEKINDKYYKNQIILTQAHNIKVEQLSFFFVFLSFLSEDFFVQILNKYAFFKQQRFLNKYLCTTLVSNFQA